MHSSVDKAKKRRLAELSHRFRQQQKFSVNYSPLYAALFGTVADWLQNNHQDPVVQWILEATKDRAAFDVSNLLAAALHHEVLNGNHEVSALAAYYPTVGGDASPEHLLMGADQESRTVSSDFAHALHNAILTCQDTLTPFLQSHTVQTNETGRGISWLLPVYYAQWKRIHLIDLGASAGLNLIADQRAFQFIDSLSGLHLMKLGQSTSRQFAVQVNGEMGRLPANNGGQLQILSRTGCDIHPFLLKSDIDERILASFIWADQVERMQRFYEALTAFHQVQRSLAPVRLFPASLPDDMPVFLDKQPRNLHEPLIIYNTYIKMYLPGKGRKLYELIRQWAKGQNRPVVWIQWEPVQFTTFHDNPEPHFGWLAWTADLWHNKQHRRYQLGWVHPHGRQVQWLPDLEAWASYWS